MHVVHHHDGSRLIKIAPAASGTQWTHTIAHMHARPQRRRMCAPARPRREIPLVNSETGPRIPRRSSRLCPSSHSHLQLGRTASGTFSWQIPKGGCESSEEAPTSSLTCTNTSSWKDQSQVQFSFEDLQAHSKTKLRVLQRNSQLFPSSHSHLQLEDQSQERSSGKLRKEATNSPKKLPLLP